MELHKKKLVLCNMCFQSQNLGQALDGKIENGRIIYCPTLEQSDVTKLAQWIFIARYRDNNFSEKATRFLELVQTELSCAAVQRFPIVASNTISEFVKLYENLPQNLNQECAFHGLRFWPNESDFHLQIRFWNKAAFSSI